MLIPHAYVVLSMCSVPPPLVCPSKFYSLFSSIKCFTTHGNFYIIIYLWHVCILIIWLLAFCPHFYITLLELKDPHFSRLSVKVFATQWMLNVYFSDKEKGKKERGREVDKETEINPYLCLFSSPAPIVLLIVRGHVCPWN